MERKPSAEFVEFDIIIHIFSISATLVGVCLTVIGIFNVSRRLSHIKSYGEELLALDALLFLATCIHSYIALRSRRQERKQRFEHITEQMFFVALVLMAFICVFIVFELI